MTTFETYKVSAAKKIASGFISPPVLIHPQASEQGRPPEHTSKFYAKGALQYLVPILTQTLTKQVTCDHTLFKPSRNGIGTWTHCLLVALCEQDENDDEDDWNPCKAAGVCLMLLATCCEDDVVPHVLPFIKEHIQSTDWRYRDASLMAFGSILEGPELNQLKPLVHQVSQGSTFSSLMVLLRSSLCVSVGYLSPHRRCTL